MTPTEYEDRAKRIDSWKEGDVWVDLWLDGERVTDLRLSAEAGAEIDPRALLDLAAAVSKRLSGEQTPRTPTVGRGHRLTDEDYDEVAQAYLEAKSTRSSVIEAVAATRDVSKSRAGNLIHEARKNGAFDRIGAPQEGTSSNAQEQ